MFLSQETSVQNCTINNFFGDILLGSLCGIIFANLNEFTLPRHRPMLQDVNTTMRAAPTVLHHKAELHWNVFGDQPRMFRGTVTRDRLPKSLLPPWLFRPVVGSFVGSGVGNDTSDISYAHRQTSGLGVEEAMPPRVGPQTDRY